MASIFVILSSFLGFIIGMGLVLTHTTTIVLGIASYFVISTVLSLFLIMLAYLSARPSTDALSSPRKS